MNCHMLLCYLVMLFLTDCSAKDPARIVLNLFKENNELKCKENHESTKDKNKTWTILEDEPFELNIESNVLDYVQCTAHNDAKKIFVRDANYNPSLIKVSNATREMGGIWHCTIRAFKNVLGAVKLQRIGNDRYAQTECFVKVHVRLKELPQLLLVNRVAMLTTRDMVGLHYTDIDHNVEYRYINGEAVDVFCINSRDKCEHIRVEYKFAVSQDVIFQNPTMGSEYGAGVRVILGPQHHNTAVDCLCNYNGNQDIASVRLKFVHSNYDAKLRINGRRTKGNFSHVGAWNEKYYNLTYNYINNEIVNISYNENIGNNKLSHDLKSCVGDISKDFGSTNIILKRDSTCNLSIMIADATSILEVINVNISRLPDKFNDHFVLNMNVDMGHPVLELYEYKYQQLMYYEYYEDRNVTVTCSKEEPPGPVTCIDFNGKTSKDKNSYSAKVPLNSTVDRSTFQCRLGQFENGRLDDADSTYYRKAKVVFRMKEKITTTSTTSTTEPTSVSTPEGREQSSTSQTEFPEGGFKDMYIIMIVVGIVCAMLICVIVILKRKRNKPCATGDPNYENLQSHNEVSIPPYPPQWSHTPEEVNYQVPADVMRDNMIYAQPVTEDPYATPIPKSQRPTKGIKQNPEPTYAELTHENRESKFSNANRSQSQYATVGELYSQVLPKSARKNGQNSYDNVFPDSRYMNSGTTEYVEPTYCQAHMMK